MANVHFRSTEKILYSPGGAYPTTNSIIHKLLYSLLRTLYYNKTPTVHIHALL